MCNHHFGLLPDQSVLLPEGAVEDTLSIPECGRWHLLWEVNKHVGTLIEKQINKISITNILSITHVFKYIY